MKYYFVYNFFIMLIVFVSVRATLQRGIERDNTIVKAEYVFGDSTDLRLTVAAVPESEFTESNVELLKEFVAISLEGRVGVIACLECNLNVVIRQLQNILPDFYFEVRYYHDSPWILNAKAANVLPRLNNNPRRCAQIIVTIEPTKGDIRVVYVKDNKSYVTNVAGVEEDADNANNEDQVYLNNAKRELAEELGLQDICDDQLFKIGEYAMTVKKPLLNDLEWQDSVWVYTCHLDVLETQKWFGRINLQNITNAAIACVQLQNDEVEWLFILHPEILNNIEVVIPISGGRTVKVTNQDADMASVVLQGRFARDVFIGRNVHYLDGRIECNGTSVKFASYACEK